MTKVTIDGINYELNEEKQTASVIAQEMCKYKGDIVIPTQVQYLGKMYSITSIGRKAFLSCISLNSITIPNSITSIEYGAFERTSLDSITLTASSVEEFLLGKGNFLLSQAGVKPARKLLINGREVCDIVIPESVNAISDYTFRGCSSLTSVAIPHSVTKIGKDAFGGCKQLVSISIPNSVTNIGDNAFQDCFSLTSVTIPHSVTKIGKDAFSGCWRLVSVSVPNSVTSIGERAFYRCKFLSSITIPDNVTNIGDETFYDCDALTSVIIPNSITSIGKGAFSLCSLRAITIPDSVKSIGERAFESCYALTSVTIGNGVTSIGERAFYRCKSLSSITIPDNVTNIGDETFYDCDALTSVIIPNSVTSIGRYAFCSCSSLTSITIPNSVNNIGDAAFYICSSLTSITIPDSVKSIGERAFESCYALTSVTIGNGVTSIGERAFDFCHNLTSVTVGNGVTSIGERAFYRCQSLSSITIPDNVTNIGDEAFGHCSSLTSIIIGKSVTNIGRFAFSACYSLISVIWNAKNCTDFTEASDNPFYWHRDITSFTLGDNVEHIPAFLFSQTKVTSITIPNSVLSIGDCAFLGCSSLTSITIPDSVTRVGMGVFSQCSSLSSIVVSKSITSIQDYTFYECSSLTSITIPDSVTYIGKGAFEGCNSLTSIIMPDNIQRIGIDIFDGCQLLQVILVPTGKKEAYCEMGLAKYCDFILEEYTEFEVDGINYCLNNNTLTAEVIQKEGGYVGSIIIPSYVVYQKATYVVTKIEGILIEEDYSHIIGPFVDCPELISIVIPNTVSYIGKDVFSKSISLSSIKVAPNNPQYDSRNNCNGIIETSTDTMIAGCKNTIIPNNIKIIASGAFNSTPPAIIFPKGLYRICGGAFAECSQLNTIHLPDSLQLIEEMAFSCCENLSTIEFGNGLKHIGSGAFECTAITSLILPNSVTFLGAFAFAGCTLLNSITLSKNLTNIGEKVFNSCESLQIIRVPKGKKEEYCKLGLEPYRDLIQEPQEEEYTILLNIAKGYELGIGITKNLAQAVIIYAQAAEKGCAEAAYHLGELYETGKGLPLDYQQAIVWYTKAVALYHPSAGQRKKHCEKILHEEEQRLFEQHKPPKYHQNQLQSSIQTAKYLFFDTETTGLPPRDLEDSSYDQIDVWPRLVQIGWIVTDENGNTIKRRGEIIRPEGFIIPKGASDVHGITTEKAMQIGVPIGKVLREIYDDMLHVKLLVAHNFGFDHKILGAEFYRKNIDTNIIDDKEHICTMLSTTNYCELLPIRFGEYKWPKLEELHHKLFGCTFSDAHDALADVEATKKCFFELKKKGIL